MARALDDFEVLFVPTGSGPDGAPLHWRSPGSVEIRVIVTSAAIERMGGFMRGVVVEVVELLAHFKRKTNRLEPDGSVVIRVEDLSLLPEINLARQKGLATPSPVRCLPQ